MADEQSGVSLNLNSKPSQNPQPEAVEPGVSINAAPAVPASPQPPAAPAQEKPEPALPPANETAPVPAPTVNPAQPTANAAPPAGDNTLLYSSEDPANDQADLEQAGFNLNIEQQKPASEVDLAKGAGDVVENIVSQATVSPEEEEKILKDLEQMDSSLELDVPIAPQADKTAKIARMVFFGVLIVSVAVLAYLFFNPAQGSARLGVKTLDPLAEQRDELSEVTSRVITNHYKRAALALHDVSQNTAKFTVASDTSRSNFSDFNDQLNAETNLETYKENIGAGLAIVEEEVSAARRLSLNSEEIEAELLIYLSDKQNQAADPFEKNLYSDALSLYRNKSLLTQVKDINLEDSTDGEILQGLETILANIQTSDINRIAYVQARRVSWSEVISELERITNSVDPGMSSISYTGYTFDADDKRVSVTGQITTPDEKTFTLITLLVDELNESDSPFVNAENTSFSKNTSGEEGFTSTLRLDFNLQ